MRIYIHKETDEILLVRQYYSYWLTTNGEVTKWIVFRDEQREYVYVGEI